MADALLCQFGLALSVKFPGDGKFSIKRKHAPMPHTTVNCKGSCDGEPRPLLSTASSARDVLAVSSNCSASELKSAFRAKVKEFHPDVRKDKGEADVMIRRIIEAYEMLSNCSRSEVIESYRECVDPFEEPECEACDLFINETVCIGKGCPQSCVAKAPNAFSFVSSTGTARATSQGFSGDYHIQLAVGQCPRSCIHYVTPSQRAILEELLDSILEVPYDTTAEADILYALIVKANFENNRYKKPKKKPTASTKHVDFY
ncbi:unnamed protein product [Rhodiola kirilowii]